MLYIIRDVAVRKRLMHELLKSLYHERQVQFNDNYTTISKELYLKRCI